MKHTIKKSVALFIALILMIPSFALAEPVDEIIVAEEDVVVADDLEVVAAADMEPEVVEAEEILLGDLGLIWRRMTA